MDLAYSRIWKEMSPCSGQVIDVWAEILHLPQSYSSKLKSSRSRYLPLFAPYRSIYASYLHVYVVIRIVWNHSNSLKHRSSRIECVSFGLRNSMSTFRHILGAAWWAHNYSISCSLLAQLVVWYRLSTVSCKELRILVVPREQRVPELFRGWGPIYM